MLIRINSRYWQNCNLNTVDTISITRLEFRDNSPTKFIVTVELVGCDACSSDQFDTFEDAEKFATNIVDQINAEARHVED